jgi:hypothetical protein
MSGGRSGGDRWCLWGGLGGFWLVAGGTAHLRGQPFRNSAPTVTDHASANFYVWWTITPKPFLILATF